MKQTAPFNCLCSLAHDSCLDDFQVGRGPSLAISQQNHVDSEWWELGVLAHWSFHSSSLRFLKALWQHWDISSIICSWQMRTLRLERAEWVTCPKATQPQFKSMFLLMLKTFHYAWIPSLIRRDLESRDWFSSLYLTNFIRCYSKEWFSGRISQKHLMMTVTQKNHFWDWYLLIEGWMWFFCSSSSLEFEHINWQNSALWLLLRPSSLQLHLTNENTE